MKVIRVFPRKTKMTPTDDHAFIGDPPLLRPQADEVHISCTFTRDQAESKRLADAWGQYYPVVKLGGMENHQGNFIPGLYVKQGVTFTSYGCNNHCPFCDVHDREGRIRENPIMAGNIVQDNNLLQCNQAHIQKVFDMLKGQPSVQLVGGLDTTRLTDDVAESIKSLHLSQLFLAADTKESVRPLEWAIKRLGLPRDKVRCYALIAFDGESYSDCLERLQTIWELGAMPFAQLYQPPTGKIIYNQEWKTLARMWSRPALMKYFMRDNEKST